MEGFGGLPGWLSRLMEETFFAICETHQSMKSMITNKKVIFCLHCCISICPFCVPSHPFHPFLKVKRYQYYDVVRFDDLKKLIDCSMIQTHTDHGDKLIFLRPKPQSRVSKSSNSICINCGKVLPDQFHFCSFTCKVKHMMLHEIDIPSILFQFDASEFALKEFENLQDSDLPDDEVFSGSSIKEKGESSKKSDEKKHSRKRKGSPH